MNIEIPKYTLLRKLGTGAMAEVWLAEHTREKRQAAIKILKPSALGEADAEKLFLRESEVLASLGHPNIVRIYDDGRAGGLAYIVMEVLTGGTLRERMERGPVQVGEALGMVVQIAGALEAAHRQQPQVIHRDLKPENIMLRDETTPVVTDFGAARLVGRSSVYAAGGNIIGTPLYMSPEQITGKPLGGTSDLYALGVIFHELLTGRLPFPGGSISEIATQHLFAQIPRVNDALAMLQPVLERLLAKEAAERYASAQQCIDALRQVFSSHEALRRQVGDAGTSMAWSSQLRILGFSLDAPQLSQVRLAQGQDSQGVASPVLAPAPASTPIRIHGGTPSAVPDAAERILPEGIRRRSRRFAIWVAICSVAISATIAAIWLEPSTRKVSAEVPVEPPLPPGPLGEAESARRAFLAAPSNSTCEGEVVLYFGFEAVDIDAETVVASVDPVVNRLNSCEVSAVLVEGHADDAERDRGFDLASARSGTVVSLLDSFPRAAIASANFGSERQAIKAGENIRFAKNRRVVVRMRGLPREQVTADAYKALGLTDPADRSQPFSKILFGYDRTSLGGPEAFAILDTWAAIMAENPEIVVSVTSSSGTDGATTAYAAGLGQRRAESIRDYLTIAGVEGSRIETVALGPDQNPLPGTDVVARMANRNVFIQMRRQP